MAEALTLLSALLALLPALLIGWLGVALLIPHGPGAPLTLRLGLAIVIGLGAAALLQFALAWLCAPGRTTILAAEGLLLGASGTVWFLRLRSGPTSSGEPGSALAITAAAHQQPVRWLVALVWAAMALGVYAFGAATFVRPMGDGDAMSMWTLRAVYMVRAPGEWHLLAAPELAHTDYPPLLPLLIARSWRLLGSESQAVPAVLSAAFGGACLLLLHGALSRWRGRVTALLGVLALMTTTVFVRQAAGQCADVPLAALVLATIVLVHDSHDPHDPHDPVRTTPRARLALAGFLAGCAAFTKNEGLVLLLALLMTTACARGTRVQLLPMLAGLCAPALALVVYKLKVSAGTDLVVHQTKAALLERVTDLGRMGQIGQAFLERLLVFSDGSHPAGNGPAPMLLWCLGCGAARPRVLSGRGIAIVLAMLVSYFLVFVITPRPLQWHLETALSRVLVQIWPASLYLLLLWARTPSLLLRRPVRGVNKGSWNLN